MDETSECLWCGSDGAKGGYCSDFCRKANHDTTEEDEQQGELNAEENMQVLL